MRKEHLLKGVDIGKECVLSSTHFIVFSDSFKAWHHPRSMPPHRVHATTPGPCHHTGSMPPHRVHATTPGPCHTGSMPPHLVHATTPGPCHHTGSMPPCTCYHVQAALGQRQEVCCQPRRSRACCECTLSCVFCCVYATPIDSIVSCDVVCMPRPSIA